MESLAAMGTAAAQDPTDSIRKVWRVLAVGPAVVLWSTTAFPIITATTVTVHGRLSPISGMRMSG